MARLSFGHLKEKTKRLLADGRALQMRAGTILYNCAGACESPIILYDWASKEAGMTGESDFYQIANAYVCRQCKWCLEARQWHLALRMGEFASLSWRMKFVTLTVTAWTKSDNDFVQAVQRYIKRVRAQNHAFYVAWVVERQKRGAPHAHLIFFEVGYPLTNQALLGGYKKDRNGRKVWQSRWPHGFSDSGICKNFEDAVRYLAKYLTKDAATRLRMSQAPRVPSSKRKRRNSPPSMETSADPPWRQEELPLR